MPTDAFHAREESFEEGYFRTKDAELVDKLKKVFKSKVDRDELRAATGITNEEVLDRLVSVSVRGEMLAVFKIYPLVEVAWADGSVSKSEIEAVLAAAVKLGMPHDGHAIARLKDWLHRGPNDDARAAWRMYAGELRKILSPAELKEFREDLVKFANKVATASGGLFGMFPQVNVREQRIIDTVTRLLS
ncbi:MAG: TerB family tellurite resistance protein [Planctomycetes bacterium]|nr:TerB family tellurite resistance protein [Planctomycetota bacterium]